MIKAVLFFKENLQEQSFTKMGRRIMTNKSKSYESKVNNKF